MQINLVHSMYSKRISHIFIWLFVIALLTGCASQTYRATSLSSSQVAKIASIAILPPQIEVDEYSAGGTSTKIDEWCAQAHENFDKALFQELSHKTNKKLQLLEESQFTDEQRKNWQETLALYKSIKASQATMGQAGQGKSMLNYSFGKEVCVLAPGADALVLVVGINRIATGGRVAVQTGAALIGVAIGVFTGIMPVVIPSGSGAYVDFLLIDAKTGNVLWFNSAGAGQMGGHDLRECKNAENLVHSGFEGFPL